MLTRYARLLNGLAQSPHAHRFVLKGAMPLMAWFDEPFRGLRDLLGCGGPFSRISGRCSGWNVGTAFAADRARIDRIREGNECGGLRIRTTAKIGGARIAVAVNIGFGDAAEPCIEMLDHPVLLDMPSPRLRGYAAETVVAEKFQAIVALGRANSRTKDYCDLWMLHRSFVFEGSRLAQAISATFARRGTRIPEEAPDSLICGVDSGRSANASRGVGVAKPSANGHDVQT